MLINVIKQWCNYYLTINHLKPNYYEKMLTNDVISGNSTHCQ